MLIKIGIAIICLLIFWQDIRMRAIYWVLFPLLFGLGWFGFQQTVTPNELLFSLSILIVLLLALTIYLSIKNGRIVNMTKGFFCWGDVLFLLSALPFFTAQNYLYFFTGGTIIVLLTHFITSLLTKKDTIPYAGYMALILLFNVLTGMNVYSVL